MVKRGAIGLGWAVLGRTDHGASLYWQKWLELLLGGLLFGVKV